jgi:hypothetical protein
MSANTPDNFAPKQVEAVVALLNHPTVKAAAEAIGVSEWTVHRWLDEPAFVGAYRRARRQAFTLAVALTQRYAPMAVNTLANVMNDATALRAAAAKVARALGQMPGEDSPARPGRSLFDREESGPPGPSSPP